MAASKQKRKDSCTDLRERIADLEETRELKCIKTEVDWNAKLGAITGINGHKNGPALLFENFKGYTNTACKKLFTNGLGSRGRLALSLGLPLDLDDRTITTVMKERFRNRVETVKRASGREIVNG